MLEPDFDAVKAYIEDLQSEYKAWMQEQAEKEQKNDDICKG